jgi:hypothetical protein
MQRDAYKAPLHGEIIMWLWVLLRNQVNNKRLTAGCQERICELNGRYNPLPESRPRAVVLRYYGRGHAVCRRVVRRDRQAAADSRKLSYRPRADRDRGVRFGVRSDRTAVPCPEWRGVKKALTADESCCSVEGVKRSTHNRILDALMRALLRMASGLTHLAAGIRQGRTVPGFGG